MFNLVPGFGARFVRVKAHPGRAPERRHFIGAAIAAVGAIGGAVIGSQANKSAASSVADANSNAAALNAQEQEAARQQFQQNAEQGVGLIGQGVQQYASTVAPNLNMQPVELGQNRGLTQQQQLGESQMQQSNEAALASSGLRGAGRAGIGSLMNANANYEANARASNDQSNLGAMQTAAQTQANARTNLGQIQAQGAGAQASTLIGAGNQIGQSLESQGQTSAALAQNTGTAAANAATGSGSQIGQAVGAVGGNVAGALMNGAGTPNSPGFGGIGGDTSHPDIYPNGDGEDA